VGCNKGDFSLLASKLVGPEGSILAFEPHPENCRWIQKSIMKNQYRNIDLHQLALSDSNGSATLHVAQLSGHHTLIPGKLKRENGLMNVQTSTLDSLLEEIGYNRTIDVIKIDVEGAEMQVLRGARETLLSNRGIVLLLDLHPKLGVDVAEVCRFLQDLGFALKGEEAPFTRSFESVALSDSLVAIRDHTSVFGHLPLVEHSGAVRSGTA
jgi:FkbM family methyltransferase